MYTITFECRTPGQHGVTYFAHLKDVMLEVKINRALNRATIITATENFCHKDAKVLFVKEFAP